MHSNQLQASVVHLSHNSTAMSFPPLLPLPKQDSNWLISDLTFLARVVPFV